MGFEGGAGHPGQRLLHTVPGVHTHVEHVHLAKCLRKLSGSVHKVSSAGLLKNHDLRPRTTDIAFAPVVVVVVVPFL